MVAVAVPQRRALTTVGVVWTSEAARAAWAVVGVIWVVLFIAWIITLTSDYDNDTVTGLAVGTWICFAISICLRCMFRRRVVVAVEGTRLIAANYA